MAIPPKTVIKVFVRDGYKCQYCDSPPQAIEQHSLHCHHTIPKSQANHNFKEFLNTCCWDCHSKHGDTLQIDKLWLVGKDVYKYNRLIAPNYKIYWVSGIIMDSVSSINLIKIIKDPFIDNKEIKYFEAV